MTSKGKIKARAIAAVLLAITTLTGVVAIPPTGAVANRSASDCGSFVSERSSYDGTPYSVRITVFHSQGLACKTAAMVVEGFWGPEEDLTAHDGPSALSYYTIRGIPGWRCYQAAGGGACRHRGKSATYTIKNL